MHAVLQVSNIGNITFHRDMGDAAVEASKNEISKSRCRSFWGLALSVPVLWSMAMLCSITMTEFVQTSIQPAAASGLMQFSHIQCFHGVFRKYEVTQKAKKYSSNSNIVTSLMYYCQLIDKILTLYYPTMTKNVSLH